MSDPHPARPSRSADKAAERAGGRQAERHPPKPAAEKRTLLTRLLEFVVPGPDSLAELIEALDAAEHRELIAPESRMMLEGVLRMAELSAGDAMVAAPRIDQLDIDAPYTSCCTW